MAVHGLVFRSPEMIWCGRSANFDSTGELIRSGDFAFRVLNGDEAKARLWIFNAN